MFCKARKIPLPLQDRIKEKLETTVRQGILEPVQPGGVTNASRVVWQQKKNGALRLCVDVKIHINAKVMDEDYPIRDMETILHNLHGASYFGKIDLSDAYYQIELDEDAKEICTINTSQGLFKMCRQASSGPKELFINLPELHCVNSQRNQGCGHLPRRRPGIWNSKGSIRQESAVKSRLGEKKFHHQ